MRGIKTEFVFDAEKHEYRLNGIRLPSVTEVIQGIFGEQPWYTDWHATKGKAIHLAIHYLVTNRLNWNTVDKRIINRIKAFELFLKETGYKVYISEAPLFHKKHFYAGTLDLILQDDLGTLVIADIKSSIEDVVELQLGGYYGLARENKFKVYKNGIVVQLKDNGLYSMKAIKNLPEKEKLFLSALSLYNWRRSKNN